MRMSLMNDLRTFFCMTFICLNDIFFILLICSIVSLNMIKSSIYHINFLILSLYNCIENKYISQIK